MASVGLAMTSVAGMEGMMTVVRKLEWTPTEIGKFPELRRLAEDVRDNETPRLLQREGEELAVIVPVGVARSFGLRGARTEEDVVAFRAAAVSWKDFDTDKLLDDIYAARAQPARPPIEQ